MLLHATVSKDGRKLRRSRRMQSPRATAFSSGMRTKSHGLWMRPESIAAKLTNSQDEGMCVCINHRSVMRNTLPLLRPDLRRLRLARQPCGAQACGLLSDRLLLGQILGHRRRAVLRHALAPQRELFAAGSRTGLARRGRRWTFALRGAAVRSIIAKCLVSHAPIYGHSRALRPLCGNPENQRSM